MIYLSGAVRKEVMGRTDMGVMLTPKMGNRPELATTWWAADTGCFTDPEGYTTDGYLRWLERLRPYWSTCLFATAPDRVGDARATLEVAMPVLQHVRKRVPAALVAQDGLQELTIPWAAFDCLFIGGTTKWKLSDATYDLVAEAKRRGKWVHQGRTNSLRRLRAAAVAGYDSADGTFLAFGPDKNLPRLEGWLRALKHQPALWDAPKTEIEEEAS